MLAEIENRLLEFVKSLPCLATKQDLAQMERRLTMKESEAIAAINAVIAELQNASNAIQAQLAKLGSSDPDLSEDGNTAVSNLQTIASAIANIIPPTPIVAGGSAPTVTPIPAVS